MTKTLKTNYKFIILSLSILSIIGCDSLPEISDTFSGRKVDYEKQSRSIDRLEMPPQLVTADTQDAFIAPEYKETKAQASAQSNGQAVVTKTTTTQIQGSNASLNNTSNNTDSNNLPLNKQVLPQSSDVTLIRENNVRYLRINAPKEDVWNKMREFWINKGMLIKSESPSTGILETEWAENRADVPQGAIRNTLGKVLGGLYSASTRDKYRVRLETTLDPNITEMYITHYGMKEVLDGSESGDSGDRTIWVFRDRDPELETEMLGSMLVFYGVETQKAKILLAQDKQVLKDKAVLGRNSKGVSELLVKETFPRAWRRTGAALDRVNFIVEDRNRSHGIYYVEYADPLAEETRGGWFSSLNFWSDSDLEDKTKYQIKLVDKEDNTLVTVHDEKGVQVASKTGHRILTLLHEQLK